MNPRLSDSALQVNGLEKLQKITAGELLAVINSDSMLRQETHFARIEEDPQLALIYGLGYSPMQRKSMLYRHIKKLLTSLHHITGGDATKSKELSEMLFLRTHAGHVIASPLPSFFALNHVDPCCTPV